MALILAKRLALILFLALSIGLGRTVAQDTITPEPRMVNGGNNEDSKAELDLLAQRAGESKLIIMIARRGSKESSRSVSRVRLSTASGFLRSVRGVEKRRIVIGEGERVNGEGRIEVYLDGKLFMVFVFRRNKGFAPEA